MTNLNPTHTENKSLEERRRVYIEIMNNIKRKRPIMNKRLDSFAWWIYVEKVIQDELLGKKLEKLK